MSGQGSVGASSNKSNSTTMPLLSEYWRNAYGDAAGAVNDQGFNPWQQQGMNNPWGAQPGLFGNNNFNNFQPGLFGGGGVFMR